ncbi:MAG: S8 family serine peptidase [Gammaproteobacteria bacterium]|nr:S8 family serine peptidase [Gammaproteobacteria bacterium]MDH5729124.1 S8 family serine peptidase [Gammaproteobacteria bacterium]
MALFVRRAGSCWILSLFLFAQTALAALLPPDINAPSDGFLVKFKADTIRSSQVHTLSTLGLSSQRQFNLVSGLSLVSAAPGQDKLSILTTLQNNANIEYVEPNYLISVNLTPNDPRFSDQYALNNIGQTNGTSDADVDALEAWNISSGNEVLVAVLDTGVDYNHPDLRANIWANPNETINGIDDDNNGYVDDIRGWDFANSDNDPFDDHMHGTHVSGIIAAVGNNGIGVTGVNWRAKIIPLKFISDVGIGSTANAILALEYAVNMGARISNSSWGGGPFSQALFDAIQAANQAGHLFVAAAGNDGLDANAPGGQLHYPSSFNLPNIISVAASNDFDQLASFSNYGVVSVDLAAPGFQILSTLPNGVYNPMSGTSMASPMVAGAASLILSVAPNLSVAQLRATLLDNVDVKANLNGFVATAGRLNVFNSLQTLASNLSVSPQTATLGVDSSLAFQVAGGRAPYTWTLSNTSLAQINSASGVLSPFAPGVVQVIVTDSLGNTARSGDIRILQVMVQPQTATITIGQQLNFSASGGVAPYAWQSSAPLVANIDPQSGVLTANSPGQVSVTVVDANGINGRSQFINIMPTAALNLAPRNATLAPNEGMVFSVSGGIAPYVWNSSDPIVASINQNGLLSAHQAGTTVVSVSDALGNSISTNSIAVQSLGVTLSVSELQINQTIVLDATGGTPPYQWRVTNSAVASIDNSGVLTGLSPGLVRVFIMDATGQRGQSTPVLITESQLLTFSPRSAILKPSESILLTVSGGTPPYIWESDNTAVLAIDANTNMLSAQGVGFASLKLFDASGASASSNLFEVREINVTPASFSLLLGETLNFSASGGRAPYTWSIKESAVASIDNSGLATSRSIGGFTVVATDVDGVEGSSGLITVTDGSAPATHELLVLPNTATLSARGSGIQFIANGGVAPYSFSLSNTAVGSINANSGQFTPNRNTTGTTTIILKDGDGHVIESGTISVL